MKITYDPYADAIYLYFTNAKVSKDKQIAKDIIVDYSAKNIPVGMEILDISDKVPPKSLGSIQLELNTEEPQELLPN